jgi:pimeloyl-[acyl-carrier protein] methyl ester esterase
VSLHTERSGSGPPLAFWHGWGMNLRVFDGLRGALGGEWRTEATDLPGHGLSPWHSDSADAALAALVATLAPGSTLVGWSLGGQFALRAAALAPERVARLVLVGTTPRFTLATGWTHGVPESTLAAMQSRLATDYRGTVSDFLELQVRGSRDAAQVMSTLRTALLKHGDARPAALSAALDWLARHDLRDALPGIAQPALVLAGAYDRVTPPGAGAALAAAMPNAGFHCFARAAHAPFLSHPPEFLATLREFLANGSAP